MTDRDRQINVLAELLENLDDLPFYTYKDEAEYLIDEYGVIVPPCKVGDYIWLVFTPKYPANPNDYGKWFMKQDGVQRIIFGAKGLSIETWNMGTIPAKELGKKIFLTKEEAEQKLKELNNNANNG